MNIWLAIANIEKTEYMGSTTKFDDIRLVMAATAEEAEKKYNDYWENQGSTYSTSYFVHSLELREPLL